MKLIFFGTSLSSPEQNRHARIMRSILDGVADRGHHVVFVESAPAKGALDESGVCKVLRYTDWDAFKLTLEREAEDASALIVTDGFAAGDRGVDWLLELPVKAHAYYALDAWDTLGAFDAEGAAPWIRADQIPAFDIVFSAAGGPAIEAFKTRWGARECVALYEAIDPAVFYPRQTTSQYVCDLAFVGDNTPSAHKAVEALLLGAARALPSHRFLVAGSGWDRGAWPDNVSLVRSDASDTRASIYSSARLVLVVPSGVTSDYTMPIELLEPAACGVACAVVERPGVDDLFVPGHEVLIPSSARDIVSYLSEVGDARLIALGHNAEKKVLLKYAKLPCSRVFEQWIARKFFAG